MRWGRDWRNSRRDWRNTLRILVTHPLKQKQIKGLFSYNFHHFNQYTPDMANIHDLPDGDLEDNGIDQRWYE